MAEPGGADPQPGWSEVVLVAIGVVAAVIGAATLTNVLPPAIREVVYQTPFAIAVLIVGTGWLLWRISRRAPGDPDDPRPSSARHEEGPSSRT